MRLTGRSNPARHFVALFTIALLGGLAAPVAAPVAAVERPVAPAIAPPAAPSSVRATVDVAGGVVPGIDIEVPTGNEISGTITAGGSPLAGAMVEACTTSLTSCRTAETAGDGTYTVDGLMPEPNRLLVWAPDESDAIWGWYTATGPVANEEDAEPVDLTAGNAAGIDLDLEVGHQISGTVLGGGSVALEGVWVDASGSAGGASTATDATGAFTIHGLPDGTYQLAIYVPQPLNYLSGSVVDGEVAPGWQEGSAVVVAGTDVTGIGIDTTAGHRISGTLTGTGAAGATVQATGFENEASATVAGNGTWQVVGLWPDTYQLRFDPAATFEFGSLFSLGYWDGGGALSANPSDAVDVAITTADRTGINATVPDGATLSGTVVADDGTPLEDAYLYVCDDTVGCVSTLTDAAGAWAFDHVPAGSYLIQAWHATHIGGYFGPGGFAVTESLATTVPVGTADRPGVNIVLPTGVTFTGSITGPGSVPIGGASVYVQGTGGIAPVQAGGGTSAADGSFELPGVGPDEYVVRVSFDLDSPYLDGYYAEGAPGNFTMDFEQATILVLEDQDVGNSYVPIAPTRVVDSRSASLVGVSGIFLANTPQTFDVAAIGDIAPDAVAVTGNVTVVGQTAAGYVAITPAATASPSSSTVNVPLGDIRANNFTTPLDDDGSLSAVFMAVAGKKANVIVDITGYFRAGDLDATYSPIAPVRVMDTRPVGHVGTVTTLAANVPQTLSVAGTGDIAADAVAVTGNLTVVGQTRAGYLAITPNPTATPSTSTLNFPLGDVRANGISVPLNDDGDLSIVFKATGGTANAILDITGFYVDDPSGLLFHPLPPGRVMDTRAGVLASGLSGLFSASSPRRLDTAGRAGVPLAAAAVTGNLTVVGQTAPGYVAVTDVSSASPSTSTLNFPLGDVRANGVTSPLGVNGELWFVYKASLTSKKTHILLDVTGYFQ